LITVLFNYSNLLRKMKRKSEAQAFAERAQSIMAAQTGPERSLAASGKAAQ
jgi:hypothetical protein